MDGTTQVAEIVDRKVISSHAPQVRGINNITIHVGGKEGPLADHGFTRSIRLQESDVIRPRTVDRLFDVTTPSRSTP